MFKRTSFLLCALFLFAASVAVSAQSTIFNVPTADTTSRGSWALEGDFITKPAKYDNGGFQTYGYRLAYGLSHKTEVGSNFYYTWDGSESYGQAEFSVKHKAYSSEKYGVNVSGGAVAFVPLRTRGADKTSVMAYGVGSKSVNPLNGLTVTGGAYHILGGKDFGDKTGAIVGITQPVTRRVSFVADWFSGKNRLGYSSAGFNLAVTKRQYLTMGYSFGNSGRGNNSLAAFYGISF